jgi:hypothetical protein
MENSPSVLSENNKNNKNIVLEVVRKNGIMLKNASDKLKKDREVVLEAIKQNAYALDFACEEFQKDKEFALEIAKRWRKCQRYGKSVPGAFYCNNFHNDKDVLLTIVKHYGEAYRSFNIKWQNDVEIALAAVESDKSMLYYVPHHLKQGSKSFKKALKQIRKMKAIRKKQFNNTIK